MSLDLMKSRGIKLPLRKTDVGGLSAEQLIKKIRSFWERCKKDIVKVQT